MKTNFYSIVPNLINEVGHSYEYTLAVEQSIKINKWHHIALIPKVCCLKDLPKNWVKILTTNFMSGKSTFSLAFVRPLSKDFLLFLSIFKKINKKRQRAIFFIEHQTTPFLFAFCLASLLLRPKIDFFHLIRYPINDLRFEGKPYYFCQKIIEWSIGKNNAKLLTDSDLIARSWKERYNLSCIILPVPHGNRFLINKRNNSYSETICWWAGAPRAEKGFAIICTLAKSMPSAKKGIVLAVSESLKNNSIFQQDNVYLVPLRLARKNYEEWLEKSCFILLPYDKTFYHARTSGIFIEALLAGTIPLVSAGTWMASELLKFGLPELILDWSNPHQVLDKIEELQRNKPCLLEIQNSYSCYHSIPSFAKILQRL